MDYASPEQLFKRAPDLDPAIEQDLAVLVGILEQASDAVDGDLRRTGDPDGRLFVVVDADTPATERVFLARGTPYLRIGYHAGTLASDAVVVGDGTCVRTWIERDGILVATDANGRLARGGVWPDGELVRVTAKFGTGAIPVAAIPEDIVRATLDIAQDLIVRSGDTSARTADRLSAEIPEGARRILQRYVAKRAMEAMF